MLLHLSHVPSLHLLSSFLFKFFRYMKKMQNGVPMKLSVTLLWFVLMTCEGSEEMFFSSRGIGWNESEEM